MNERIRMVDVANQIIDGSRRPPGSEQAGA
jgi:hypothetical protein